MPIDERSDPSSSFVSAKRDASVDSSPRSAHGSPKVRLLDHEQRDHQQRGDHRRPLELRLNPLGAFVHALPLSTPRGPSLALGSSGP
jgi:hypothetical protein